MKRRSFAVMLIVLCLSLSVCAVAEDAPEVTPEQAALVRADLRFWFNIDIAAKGYEVTRMGYMIPDAAEMDDTDAAQDGKNGDLLYDVEIYLISDPNLPSATNALYTVDYTDEGRTIHMGRVTTNMTPIDEDVASLSIVDQLRRLRAAVGAQKNSSLLARDREFIVEDRVSWLPSCYPHKNPDISYCRLLYEDDIVFDDYIVPARSLIEYTYNLANDTITDIRVYMPYAAERK